MSLVHEKIEQASKLVKEFDIDCWITFVRETELNGDPTLDYILGADLTWHSAFIFTKDGSKTAMIGKFDFDTVNSLNAYDNVIAHVKGIEDDLTKYLKELNPKSIALNYSVGSEICDGLTHGMYLYLLNLLDKIGMSDRIISAEKIISALRERKTESELKLIKKAVDEAEHIFDQVPKVVKEGMTEIELASFMKNLAYDKDYGMAWQELSCPAVFFGPDAASAHFAPSDRKLEKGQIIHIDFGVKVNGYCSDLQRGFYTLRDNESKEPDEINRAFSTVALAIEKAAASLKPGVKGVDIDKIARDEIINNGYEEFACALGHQVGRFAHDGTALIGPAWEKYANKPFEFIEEGMVFTLEPHIYVPNYGMASIEEMVIVTNSGCEFLSKPQKEIRLIRL